LANSIHNRFLVIRLVVVILIIVSAIPGGA